MSNEQDLSTTKLLLLFLVSLIAGHFLLEENWSILSIIAIFVCLLLIVYVINKSIWSTTLLLLSLNIFALRERAGGFGTWMVIFAFIIIVIKRKYLFNTYILFLLITIISSCVIALLVNKNELEIVVVALSGVISSLALFLISSSIMFSVSRVKQFLIYISILVFLQFMILVNQRLGLIDGYYSPFLSRGEMIFTDNTSFDEMELYINIIRNRPIGSYLNYELSAEWAGISFCILFPWIFQKKILPSKLSSIILISVVLSFMCMIASNTRAPLIYLLFLQSGYIIFMGIFLLPRSRYGFTLSKFLFLLFITILLIQLFGMTIGWKTIIERFSDMGFIGITPINRLSNWRATIQKIIDTFPIGYGPLRPEEFFNLVGFYSHSLYLSLPLHYGFIGAISIIIIFFITIIRLFIKIRKSIYTNQIIYWNILIAFTMSILFVLLDQYKIEMVRSTSYTNYIFGILGLAYSITKPNTLKRFYEKQLLN